MQAVRLEQLGNPVDRSGTSLAHRVQVALRRGFLVAGQAGIGIDRCQPRADIGQREGLRIVRRKELAALFHQIGIAAFFVDREEQLFLQLVDVLAEGLLLVAEFRLVQQPAQLGIFHEAQELAVTRLTEFQLEQQRARGRRVPGL